MPPFFRRVSAVAVVVWSFAARLPAQAPEPGTYAGAADALRTILFGYGPASPLSYAREIANAVIRSDLTCLPNQPNACRLTDNEPRIIIRVFSLGDEKPGQPLDSVEVQLTTFSNTHARRNPSVIFMDKNVTAWAFYYRDGRWVKGRLVSATAS